MLDKIKKSVFSKYATTESKWVFITGFDSNWTLVFSNWLAYSDKTLWELIDSLYYWIAEKQKDFTKLIVIDVMEDLEIVSNPNDILWSLPSIYWFLVISPDSDKSWIILPNTIWVADAKNALFLIRQKYWLDGKAAIYRFKTQRILIS